jgi:uncharacterized repeat protein (TIGR01451 family)
MSALRFRQVGFGARFASLLALVLMTTVVAVSTPLAQRASAQEASAVTASLTPSTTRPKVYDVVTFTLHVENTGTATIPGLYVDLVVGDALDTRGTHCDGDTQGTTDSCLLGDFAPGASTYV